jgi:hypothetical protein
MRLQIYAADGKNDTHKWHLFKVSDDLLPCIVHVLLTPNHDDDKAALLTWQGKEVKLKYPGLHSNYMKPDGMAFYFAKILATDKHLQMTSSEMLHSSLNLNTDPFKVGVEIANCSHNGKVETPEPVHLFADKQVAASPPDHDDDEPDEPHDPGSNRKPDKKGSGLSGSNPLIIGVSVMVALIAVCLIVLCLLIATRIKDRKLESTLTSGARLTTTTSYNTTKAGANTSIAPKSATKA